MYNDQIPQRSSPTYLENYRGGFANHIAMKQQIITIASLVALSYGVKVDNSKLDPLQFKKDGTFQIAIFSDMHFGQCKLHQHLPPQKCN